MIETVRKARCLLCSLVCPVAFDVSGSEGAGQVLTEYVADDALTRGRLCFRGHYLADMATHPFRLTAAELRGGRKQQAGVPVSIDEVVASLSSRLQRAGKAAAILVDGNLPTEDIAAALRLAHEVVETDLASVYLPESDAAMLRGIRAGTPILRFEDVPACDLFLAVGDAFATHPVVSRPLLEKRAARKAKLFGMDCMPNSVAGFAEAFLCVKPGGEAAALAALCKMMKPGVSVGSAWADDRSAAELAETAGTTESALRPVAEALSKAEQPAILLDPVSGRMTHVAESAAVASILCEVSGARLMPMFRYGNTVGAARAAAGLGAVPLAETVSAVLAGKVAVLFSIGLDPLCGLAPEDAVNLRGRVSTFAVASAFPNRSTEGADVVLPLAVAFEEAGSVLDPAGSPIDLKPLMAPPGGAMTAREICARLAAAAGASLTQEEPPRTEVFMGRVDGPLEVADTPSDGIRLVARADTTDFDLGSVSRLLAWPRVLEPIPELLMNASDVKTRGLTPRTNVLVRASGAEAHARLQVAENVPEGMAAVSAAFEETRPLFGRGADGIELTPSEAEITPETER